MSIGYARVSIREQYPEGQSEVLNAAGRIKEINRLEASTPK